MTKQKKVPEKVSYLELIFTGFLAIFFAALASLSFIYQLWIALILFGSLTFLCVYLSIEALKKGLRPPTKWEWFKLWMIIQPIIFVVITVAILYLVVNNGAAWFGIELVQDDKFKIGIVIFAILMLIGEGILIWRAPHRHESDDAYKKRIAWQESE